jgi:hypothetical protein
LNVPLLLLLLILMASPTGIDLWIGEGGGERLGPPTFGSLQSEILRPSSKVGDVCVSITTEYPT